MTVHATLIAALGKESDNFYAEMLFKAVGAHAQGRPATADAGAEAACDLVRTELGRVGRRRFVRLGPRPD